MKSIRKKLTYSNVMATIAVFIALGGVSYAAVKLPKNSVGTKQLKPNSVNSSKIAGGSVGVGDLSKGARPRSGATGPTGTPGNDGLNGAAVVVRARSTGSVDTPSDGSPVAMPLSNASWTQGASEIDLGPYGGGTFLAPTSGACGGFIDLNWTIVVNGKNYALGTRKVLPNSDEQTFSLDPGYKFEPGTSVSNTATVSLNTQCESGPAPVSVKVTDFHFDVIAAK